MGLLYKGRGELLGRWEKAKRMVGYREGERIGWWDNGKGKVWDGGIGRGNVWDGGIKGGRMCRKGIKWEHRLFRPGKG